MRKLSLQILKLVLAGAATLMMSGSAFAQAAADAQLAPAAPAVVDANSSNSQGGAVKGTSEAASTNAGVAGCPTCTANSNDSDRQTNAKSGLNSTSGSSGGQSQTGDQ